MRKYCLMMLLLCGLCVNAQEESGAKVDSTDIKEVVEEQQNWTKYHYSQERRISRCLRATAKKYDLGQAVDLNDYLCWVDSTKDWNGAFIPTETAEWLNDKGLYYDAEYKEWILKSQRHYKLFEKPIYFSVSRVGMNDRLSCLCDWQLEGRRMVSRMVLPDLKSTDDVEGTVVVRIFVTSNGKVWMAWKAKGTTAKKPILVSATVDAAKQVRFNEGKPQAGKITYYY